MAGRNSFFAGLMAAATLPGASIAPAQSQDDVVAFCRAHLNDDSPNRAFFGDRYTPGAMPRQLSQLYAQLKWRCRDGKVLVCSDSTDGDWCSRKDTSPKPSPLLAQACREEPEKASFSFAEAHYSAFDWRCRRGIAVIARRYALDRRSFFQAPWVPLIVTHGAVTGPTDFPAGPR